MSVRFRLPLPTGNWMYFLLAPVLLFVSTSIDRNYQSDLWHHLARGRAILAEGRLLDTDRFTYTVADTGFQDNNWLWQIAFYKLYTLGGLDLVQTINSAILFVAMACLVLSAWRRSGSLKAACAVGVLTFLGVWQLATIRPQTASFLLFIVLACLLDEAQKRRGLLLLPPLILALWANLHGGFPIGLLLVGCYTLAAALTALYTAYKGMTPGAIFPQLSAAVPAFLRRTGPWLLCLAGSILATGANPYGYRIYEYVRHTSGIASARQILEWQPPDMHWIVARVLVLTVLLLLLTFALGRRRPTVQELCLLFCFLPLAFGAMRMVAWFMFIAAPILATHGAELLPKWREDEAKEKPSWLSGVGVAVLLLVSIISLPWLENYNPALQAPGRTAHREEYDVAEAVDFLKGQKAGARLYAKLEWGEFLGWSQWNDSRVFMDGRIEIYPNEVWDEYWAIHNARADWQDVLDRYGVDFLVLDTKGTYKDLLQTLAKADEKPQTARWREVYKKGVVVIYARRPVGDSLSGR